MVSKFRANILWLEWRKKNRLGCSFHATIFFSILRTTYTQSAATPKHMDDELLLFFLRANIRSQLKCEWPPYWEQELHTGEKKVARRTNRSCVCTLCACIRKCNGIFYLAHTVDNEKITTYLRLSIVEEKMPTPFSDEIKIVSICWTIHFMCISW